MAITQTLRRGVGFIPRVAGRLVPGSSAGRVALGVFLLLFIILVAVWVARWQGRDNVALDHAMTGSRLALELGLTLLIPLVLYWALSLKRVTRVSPYPGIDEAWKAGLEAIARQGETLKSKPLFLILGSPHSEVEHQMMENSITELSVRGVPHAPGEDNALHWYMSQDAIYLFLTGTCSTSAEARQWTKNELTTRWTEWQPNEVSDLSGSMPTYARQAAKDRQTGSGARAASQSLTRLGVTDEGTSESDAPATLASSVSTPVLTPAARTRVSAVDRNHFPPLSEVERDRQLKRLQYLCERLRRERSPHCGINGIVTLLPIEIAAASPTELTNLSIVARRDIEVIQQTLQMYAPVTTLLLGLDRWPGFAEFVNRLPRNFVDHRLGSSFDVLRPATPDELTSHSDRVCDDLHNYVFRLFGSPEALRQPQGNRRLYELLCQTRALLKPNLRVLLGKAFGSNEGADAKAGHRVQFSGCYFAAVGTEPGEAAFVKGVIEDKLLDEQDYVSWFSSRRWWNLLMKSLYWVGWAIFWTALALILYRLVENLVTF